MAKKVEIIKPLHPDFFVGENNCVFAAYVTGTEILEKDDPKLIGVPFIFYDGTTRHSIVNKLKSEGISYLSGSQLEALTKNAQMKGRVPETVRVHGNDIPWRELLRLSPFGGAYVPYSFGVFHEDDLKRGFRIRTQVDYNRLVSEILPEIFAQRQAKTQQEAQIESFYSNPLNIILSTMTRGWYGPKYS